MFFTLILIVALVGIVVGFVLSKKGDGRGSAIMTVAAILGMTVGMAHFFFRGKNPVDEHPIKVQEWHFASIAAQRMGVYLVEQQAATKALVVMPFELRTSNERRKAMMDGLGKALGEKITVVKIVDPPMPPAVKTAYESRMNPDMEQQEIPDFTLWFTAAYFDRLLQENPGDYTLVISLAGLPEDAANMRCIREKRGLKFATTFSPLFKLHPLMKDGHLIADVQQHPSPNPEAEPPDDEALIPSFDRRYLLITPANMAELKQKYPDLF